MGGLLLVTDDVTRTNLSTASAVVKTAIPRRSCVAQKSPTQMSCANCGQLAMAVVSKTEGFLQELTTLPRLTSQTHLVKDEDPL
jgi:hypothetical protein